MNDETRQLLIRLLLEQERTDSEAGQKRRNQAKGRLSSDEDGGSAQRKRRTDAQKQAFAEDLASTRKDIFPSHESNITDLTSVPIWEKYALTVAEASKYFHLGQRKLRDIIKMDKHAKYLVWNKGHVYIKRKLFEEWLDGRTEV